MLKGFNFAGLNYAQLVELLDVLKLQFDIIEEFQCNAVFPDEWHDAMSGYAFALSRVLEEYPHLRTVEIPIMDADELDTQEYDATDWQPDPLPEPVEVPDDALSAFTAFFETWDDDQDDAPAVSS
jgi:hypothetical protein